MADEAAPVRRRRRPRSVRVRTTAVATLVVGVALAVAGVALVLILQAALTGSIERSVRQQARAAAEVLAAGQTPGPLVGGDDDTVAQVLDERGRVLQSSRALGEDAPPLVARPVDGHATAIRFPHESERFLAVAAHADAPAGPRTVVVASTLEIVDRSVDVVTVLLLLGLPLLLAVVAAVTWRVVGRALAPVEAIRATAEATSAANLSRRVPEPGTGDEVARLATTMNTMLDRLEAAQRRQRRFVADASHELRSPVASLRQHAEVTRAHPDAATTAELSEVVLAEALRLQRMIDDLLLLARADEDGLVLRRRPVDLDDVVLDEARRLRATTRLDVDASAVSAGGVDGDAEALRRVVRNVVDNAARHAAGRVRLALVEEDGTVAFTVEDDGPGVALGERERVFERFVRLDDARGRDADGASGAGLGLAIVAEVVAAHGGTVTIGDGSLGGARVETRLPARR